ncbi:hypothetical protein TRFO_42247 [Tritrichomonas foetus]|uniref:Nucleotide-diphospho-sugar transferase domain-containing protein n=1 Tax=Tritrichomonas foetus TaxID=1144522 RepID=A0A1J4KX66_9EUKA|nr:hypothetical protein TRFO_42247 [Tritrichomonas foetus]|eukprot:OHT15843.1 hypothetical protein TRFO_42247 [Tritrichomonas foetus]
MLIIGLLIWFSFIIGRATSSNLMSRQGIFTVFYSKNILINFGNCLMCNLAVNNELSNSKSTDLIMGSLFQRFVGIFPCIRSLRTTNCQANVIIFIDDKCLKSISNDNLAILRNCNIKLYNVGPNKMTDPRVLQFFRHVCYYDFLKSQGIKFTRILAIDVFDAVFQGDPFTSEFKEDRIYFCQEPVYYGDNEWNFKHLKVFIEKDEIPYYGNFTIINGGIIFGGYHQYFTFLHEFLQRCRYTYKRLPSDDQGLINFIVYSQLLQKKYGFTVELWNYTNLFANIYVMGTWNLNWYFGNLTEPTANRTYKLVHQIYMNTPFCHSVKEVCPQGNIKIKKYVKCNS